jgi:hypothetical protein
MNATEFVTICGYLIKVTDLLLAAFTGLLFVATLLLWLDTHRLANESKASSERQLRSYVGVTTGEFRGINNGALLGAQIALKNYGQTPAHHSKLYGKIHIAPFPLPENHNFPDSKMNLVQPMVVFPNPNDNNFGWLEADHLFSPAEISLITNNSSNQRAYLVGKVVYKDIFDADRTTKFCFFLDPASIKHDSDRNILGFNWAIAEYGNEIS